MYKASTGVWMGHAHNLYIMLAAETGIVGLSLFCAWVAWVYGRGVRSFSVLAARDLAGGTMLFSYLVAFGGCILFNLSDVTVAEPKVNAIAWLLLASIAGIGDGRERSGEKRC
jgi:O-antigen ligase